MSLRARGLGLPGWLRRACAGGLILGMTVAQAQLATPVSPSAVVEAFHRALRSGDGRAALALMARDVSVFEQGFAEISRDGYAKSQLEESMRFARATERHVISRQVGEDGATAWVISTTQTTGNFEGRALVLDGTETVLLRRDNQDWKIMHVHWSAHPGDTPPAP